MIITVTLNAALDITYRVPRFTPSTAHRVTETIERPGGTGVTVARLLAALGHRTVVTGFAGGPTGEVLRRLLAEEYGTERYGRERYGEKEKDGEGDGDADGGGRHTDRADRAEDTPGAPGPGRVEEVLTPVSGSTRRTIGVVDTATGEVTRLKEAGPVVTRAEWDSFHAAFTGLLPGADAVALCGSLPPGLPVGSYATLVRAAQAAGVPVLLDTHGEPLRRGIAARPDLVATTAGELTALTGFAEPVTAAHEARRRGARAVAASLGGDGVLVATADGSRRAAPPRPPGGDPTRACEAAVAGLLSALAEGLPWPERLSRAVALSAAAATARGPGEFDHAAYTRLLPDIEATEHPL
ncbi:1-phosphofructokinase family hexose kinase [Streptomyces xinghaiensis]|uniref:1-phosphofructokinase family hexose kinase n=1 Tax=Streptomyces xinghaiensis TaxID=1038928 RepID=UPI002E0FE3D5|nr:PfkB family carbohydrate kinase [Streptomyces xinghaiensis]